MKSIIVKLSVALALNTTLAFSASGLIQEEKNLRSTYAYQGLSACQMICDAADAPAAIAYYAVIPGLSFAGSYLPASCQDSFQTGLTYTTYLLHGLSIYANPVKHAVGYTVGGLGVLAAKKLLENSSLSAAQRREIEGAVYFFGRSSGALAEFGAYEDVKTFLGLTSRVCKDGDKYEDMRECNFMVNQIITHAQIIKAVPETPRRALMREISSLAQKQNAVGFDKIIRAEQFVERAERRFKVFGTDTSKGNLPKFSTNPGLLFSKHCHINGNMTECSQQVEYVGPTFNTFGLALDTCEGTDFAHSRLSTDLFRKEGERLVQQANALESIVEESFFSKVLSVFKVDALWIFEFPEIHIG